MRASLAAAVFVLTILMLSGVVMSQVPDDHLPLPFGDRKDREMAPTLKEMLSKQRVIHDKKEFAELQERGDEALRISLSLADPMDNDLSLSAYDREKLVDLERVVKKIRDELGADDPGDGGGDSRDEPHSVPAAFKSLRETTASLAKELKKASRFTISAAAIQTSNSALKLIRFLRLKK